MWGPQMPRPTCLRAIYNINVGSFCQLTIRHYTCSQEYQCCFWLWGVGMCVDETKCSMEKEQYYNGLVWIPGLELEFAFWSSSNPEISKQED